MIIEIMENSKEFEIIDIINRLESDNLQYHINNNSFKKLIIVNENEKCVNSEGLIKLKGVKNVFLDHKKIILAAKEENEKSTKIILNNCSIGGGEQVVIAGPCSVESEEQLLRDAREIAKAGGHILRGGVFKPRTSPYDFQGLGKEGLRILEKVKKETGLNIITEVMDSSQIDEVMEVADILQIGSRNMQNYELLKVIGETRKPIMLKRGLCSTVNEWLLAAEYILLGGNSEVILCERGIRTFGKETRNTLDISAVPLVKSLSHLPIIVDPSHGTGIRSLIAPMTKAALATGADGVMIEVHGNPEKAISDGKQCITTDDFQLLMDELKEKYNLC